MKRRLIFVCIIFILVLGALFAAAELSMHGTLGGAGDAVSRRLVLCSDISGYIKENNADGALFSLEQLKNEIAEDENGLSKSPWFIICFAVSVIFVISVFTYIWFSVLLPFEKMKEFAAEVARGNLDLPLNLTRGSYFGAFTWAFDSMRQEIVRSRAAEKEAVENGKTVIAALSHDIKTPVSSLRLYTEALEANMDTTAEKRQKYIDIIKKKCDEIARLTNDLFMHSLSEMGKLSINPERLALNDFLSHAVSELSADGKSAELSLPDKEISVMADRKRLMQICENLTNNAAKYAKTPVHISLSEREGMAQLIFRDDGPGIPDGDLPFIFGKFYRGKNAGDENGSGLGLYIVKQLTEKMGGSVSLRNKGGLEVTVELPLA